MPNWCYNLLTVRGSLGDLREFRALTAGREAEYADDAPADDGEPEAAWLPLAFHALVPVPPDVRAAGYAAAGRDWQCKHWGTQWELTAATRVLIHSESLTFDFDTAWSPPTCWFAAVAAQYPWLTLALAYLEPGMEIAGLVRCKGGVVVEHREFNGDVAAISAFGEFFFGFDPYAGSSESADNSDGADADDMRDGGSSPPGTPGA